MHNQKTGRACGMILVVFGRWDKENYRFIFIGETMNFQIFGTSSILSAANSYLRQSEIRLVFPLMGVIKTPNIAIGTLAWMAREWVLS